MHFSIFLTLAFQLLVGAQGDDLKATINTTGLNVSVLLPDDPGFQAASRPFNLRFTFEPAAIAFPSTVQEVSQIVKLGHPTNHRVVARSGGHSYIANGLGGKDGVIVVDMGGFRSIDVDSKSGTAIIGTGNRLGDIVTGLIAQGRALPHGTCPYVGIGGHAAYGGYGFTSRLWGLTLDAILSIDLVLANGTITTASRQRNADIFWAMRGAGPSFAIATSITVNTFPAPPSATIFSFNWQFTAAGAAQALAAWQKFVLTDNLPPHIGAEIVLTKGNVQGNVTIGLAGGWYGPADQLNATLAPFFETVPPPRAQSFDVGDYLHSAINLAGGSLDTDSAPDTTDTFYAKSLMTPQDSPITDKAFHAFMDVLANEGFTTSVGWFFQMELFGGKHSAINAVRSDATSFANRNSLFTIQFYASAPGSEPPYPEAGFQFLDDSANSIIENSPPDWNYGAYTNYADDLLVDWQRRYYGSNYPRLHKLKDLYDPKGVFTFPIGIEN